MEWDLVRGSDYRNNSTSMPSDGVLRRWQTDTLRENDSQRMGQLCEELRRKRESRDGGGGGGRGGTKNNNTDDRTIARDGTGSAGGKAGGSGGGSCGGGGKPLPTDTKRASAWEWGRGGVEGLGPATARVGGSGTARRISVSSGGDGRRRGL